MNRVKRLGGNLGKIPSRAARRIDVAPNLFHMKPLGWFQFTWDLATLPTLETKSPEHYQIGRAAAGDIAELRKVFSSCFMLDPVWNPAIGEVMRRVQSLLDHAFDSDHNACLALRHGSRIIGAALLFLDPKVDNHLAPGPSVLMEYRNRGFGTLLLERSLEVLRQAGLTHARGLVRDIAPAAKFLYPKFGGTGSRIDITPLVAA